MYYVLMLSGVLGVHHLSELNIMAWASKAAGGSIWDTRNLRVCFGIACVSLRLYFKIGGSKTPPNWKKLKFHCLAACISLWQVKYV